MEEKIQGKMVVDKAFRLRHELEKIRKYLINCPCHRKIYFKIYSMDIARSHYVLEIMVKKSFYWFDDVLGEVFPRTAGGEADNTYDVMLNRDLSEKTGRREPDQLHQ